MRKYQLVPLPQDIFEGYDLTTRACFGLIYDRWKQSSHRSVAGDPAFRADYVKGGYDGRRWRRWEDTLQSKSFDPCFAVYGYGELSLELGCSERTVRRAVQTLEREGLIWRSPRAYGGCNRIHPATVALEYLQRKEQCITSGDGVQQGDA